VEDDVRLYDRSKAGLRGLHAIRSGQQIRKVVFSRVIRGGLIANIGAHVDGGNVSADNERLAGVSYLTGHGGIGGLRVNKCRNGEDDPAQHKKTDCSTSLERCFVHVSKVTAHC
jgi:hypothetical protein